MRADVFVAVFGLACIALGLTAGRAFPTARAVERWLDDAEEMAQGSVRDLPEADLAVDPPADDTLAMADVELRVHLADVSGAQDLRGVVGAGLTRLPSAVERAAMYDTLTNDPPGPVRSTMNPGIAGEPSPDRAGGHQREGRGRADRRDWHKHRGPYAPAAERHVTLAQAEHEAEELRHRWHDDALRREFKEWQQEMDAVIGAAYDWYDSLPDRFVAA